MNEIEERIQQLTARSADPAYGRLRADALDHLLAHAEEAHPRLLELAKAHHPPALVLLALPHFGRAESVPVLESALRNAPDPTTAVAAQALAEHPSPEARTVLEQALADPRDQVVASAADALAQRGDPASCDALRAALGHPDPDVRRRVREAADALRCP